MPAQTVDAVTGFAVSARRNLEIDGVSKSWGSTKALSSVSFSVAAGEVVALVGENGAGKSTLMGILSGVTQPDEGEIRLSGRPVRFGSPQSAQAHGIGTVFQELSLAQNLTAMENIFAGRLPSRLGFVDFGALRRRAEALFTSLDLAIDPEARISDLPVSSRQVVEIAKALSLDANFLLLDEPTSALNADEKAALFRLVASLKSRGVGIIYISHHLDEVLQLADRIVVLRDGHVVSVSRRGEADSQSLVRDMVGRIIDASDSELVSPRAEILLDVRRLSGGLVDNASFTLRKGEIVALAGLMGSGRSALVEMIVGLMPASSGEIILSGKRMGAGSMAAAKRRGIGYIPPERKTDGLFLDLPLAANIASASLGKLSNGGFVDNSATERLAWRYVERLSIKADDVDIHCRALSGGNQQKVLLAKWLEVGPSLLVVEEPTKGVDIAAKHDIHREMLALAASSTGILLVSSDLPEILSIAHRVLIMHQGRIVADLDCRDATEQAIVAHASGLSGDIQ
jgi:ABC-type sugar transport system ATPase subunit